VLWKTGWLAAIAITVGAAALRLVHLGSVPVDPFYDGAVRSMTLSWHNFFFGAAEPSATVSIDKPPVDLWLQVASVKIFGFNSAALKLPQALAGTVSVPLIFEAVRRLSGTAAGLASALAMAVLPIEVITARSDTMDAVMMALLALALLLVVLAAQRGRTGLLLCAAAALGVAFDVKLDESLIAIPGLLLIAYLGLPGSRRRRLAQISLAGVVYVAVALSWLTATLLVPAHHRPYAIGSTNGSAWNAAFIYNGTDRITGKATPGEPFALSTLGVYPQKTQAERDQIPIPGPSPTRLLARVGPLSGERLGLEVLVALLLGLPALAFTWLTRKPDDDAQRMRLAGLAGLSLWLAIGVVLFSGITRLHPRYTEGFTPAVAAMFGVGVAWATTSRQRIRLAVLVLCLAVVVFYAAHLLFGLTAVWWITLVAAVAATGFALGAKTRIPATAATLAALLAIPTWAALNGVRENVSDANRLGVLAPSELDRLSSYLRAQQGSARYEVAYDSATKMGALVVKDARPVLPLTSMEGHVLTSVARLKALIASGEVRYAYLSSLCGRHSPSTNSDCSEPARWVRAHATDVSRAAGLPRNGLLWRLPGVMP
jgi:4-amino-4-deoxy-L-arabinose transferase-like glycosyltransferase